MEKKIFIGVVLGSLLVLALAMLVPTDPPQIDEAKLPWAISLNSNQQTTIFGITLEKTSLSDAQLILENEGKMSLFLAKNGEYTVEVFLDSIYLSGLKADLFLTLDVSQSQAKDMFKRSTSMSRASEQTNKINLSTVDKDALLQATIRHVTYIPRANLDAELISKRFGTPEQKISGINKVEHWLYASKGLDIALNPEGREVFQYISPPNFNQILDPLLKFSQNPGQGQVQGLRP